MKTDLVESVDTFTINIGGGNEIDSEALAALLSNVAKIIKLTTQEIDKNAYCKLNFLTKRDGSIEVDFATVIREAKTMFHYATVAVGTAYLATETFKKMLEIKDFLGGKKPKEIIDERNEMKIVNQAGAKIAIDKKKSRADLYFKDPVFENCIVNFFSPLEQEQRGDFTFARKMGKDELVISKENYKEMKKTLIEKNEVEKITTDSREVETDLIIKKPDLLGNSKWEVIFDRARDVKISDEQFLARIKTGKIKLYAGCKIEVKMKITTRLDEKLNVKDEPDYDVYEVIGDIIEPIKDPNLFEEEDGKKKRKKK